MALKQYLWRVALYIASGRTIFTHMLGCFN